MANAEKKLMNPIISLTDFSPISLNAVQYAAGLAFALKTDLLLLHICLQSRSLSEVFYPTENIEELVDTANKKLLSLKDDLATSTGRELKVATEVRAGTILTQTENFCSLHQPFAVVMGVQVSSAAERLFFGSNTTALIKHLPWPLIVVPPAAKFKQLKKIGFACDLDDPKECMPLKEINILVKNLNALLYVFHISKRGTNKYSESESSEFNKLKDMLGDVHPVYEEIEDPDVWHGITNYADVNNLDLLVIIAKNHNLITRLSHKTVSERLLVQPHRPIMLSKHY